MHRFDKAALEAAEAILGPLGFTFSLEVGGKKKFVVCERDGKRYRLPYSGTPRAADAKSISDWTRQHAQRLKTALEVA